MENLAMPPAPATAQSPKEVVDSFNQHASDAGCELKLAIHPAADESNAHANAVGFSPRGRPNRRRPPSGPPSAYGRPAIPSMKPHTPLTNHGFGGARGGNVPASADAY